ncbi:UbiX family flavin prenyltransferase [Caldinitratiruptor microaerophilus]|uniref:Flavin prenyltransferase UbiX n=1 Tax=Caldinitratiruptor microaerophilus TaxID=671077 RepID=A0AA35CHW1_9FIRM|nr:UbiX family flavin prenyltransferase [Caldinitratiruptor microaerophilus]BDG59212.1 phenolic acid decarboxylase subunit B [Caldinitratiruptor microaerophilus]
MRLIVGISGASGVIYGVRLLEVARELGVETHLIATGWARRTIEHELGRPAAEVTALATASYHPSDLSSPVASGSFQTAGMVVLPCSMKTLGALAAGYTADLLTRAADVCLKERRTLVLCPRETPLHAIHLENMLRLSRAGAIIMPPVPAFYDRPRTLQDVVDHFVGRVLDHFGIRSGLYAEWQGMGPEAVDEP